VILPDDCREDLLIAVALTEFSVRDEDVDPELSSEERSSSQRIASSITATGHARSSTRSKLANSGNNIITEPSN